MGDQIRKETEEEIAKRNLRELRYDLGNDKGLLIVELQAKVERLEDLLKQRTDQAFKLGESCGEYKKKCEQMENAILTADPIALSEIRTKLKEASDD